MDKVALLEQKIGQLETNYATLANAFAIHQHDVLDGTNRLRKSIELDIDQYLKVGLSTQATQPVLNSGLANEQFGYSLAVGADDGRIGFVNKADLLQINLLHQPKNALLQSFITAVRTPVVSSFQGTSLTVTAAGNTVTIAGYNFTTNELAGALIDIYNSSGDFIETQVIASNTGTVVTIVGTWLASTSNATFQIYAPVFMGSADNIFQRFYANEGTAGGIRFGIGPTNTGQNGLIHMDAAGDLFWRNKAGTSIKLSTNINSLVGVIRGDGTGTFAATVPLAGTKVYYVSDTSGGAVTRKLTFTDGILTSET